MLRASLGKVVHTGKRAGTYAAKVSLEELHKIAVHVRAVVQSVDQTRREDADIYPDGNIPFFHLSQIPSKLGLKSGMDSPREDRVDEGGEVDSNWGYSLQSSHPPFLMILH